MDHGHFLCKTALKVLFCTKNGRDPPFYHYSQVKKLFEFILTKILYAVSGVK